MATRSWPRFVTNPRESPILRSTRRRPRRSSGRWSSGRRPRPGRLRFPRCPRARRAPERRSGDPIRRAFLVLQQRSRKIRSHEAGRNGVDTDVVRPELNGKIAHELEVGGLGDAIGADHVGADLAPDRRHVDDRAVLPLPHVARDHLREPEVGLHVGRHDLGEGVVRDVRERAVVRVDGGVADDDVDVSQGPAAFLDQVLEFLLAPHVAREAQHGESPRRTARAAPPRPGLHPGWKRRLARRAGRARALWPCRSPWSSR